MSEQEYVHIPVLLNESVEALVSIPDGVYVDVTFGGGGHTRAILEKLNPEGRAVSYTHLDVYKRQGDYFSKPNPEDVGMIGDVNQGFAGLQEKYGDLRVFDTGIREWTIIGQAIGMSMRGLRPVSYTHLDVYKRQDSSTS